MSEEISREVFDFSGNGIAMTMYNLDASIKGFARALRRAFSIDRNSDGVPSTKGSMF